MKNKIEDLKQEIQRYKNEDQEKLRVKNLIEKMNKETQRMNKEIETK